MTKKSRCSGCGKPLNPVEVLLGEVCGKCVDEKVEKLVKGG